MRLIIQSLFHNVGKPHRTGAWRSLGLLLVLASGLVLTGCGGGVVNTSRTFRTVVLDPGHGGHDSGATTRYAGREKDLALDTALRIRRKLEAAGFHTVMTRTRDVFIPLDDRARISNRRSNAIFVSVHYNYGGRSGASGVEIFYKSPVSRAIAQNILREMNAIPGTASRGVKTADFRVLRKNRFPAVLVECGFLTSPSEGRRCAQPEYREALADAIVRGIRNQREGR